MKKIFTVIMLAVMLFVASACANRNQAPVEEEDAIEVVEEAPADSVVVEEVVAE